MDDLDKRLLNRIQSNFPVVVRPYQALADAFGTTEQDVLERFSKLRADHVIRQVSAIFDTKSLGYKSSLVAMKIPADRLAAGAQIINSHPGVTHNYERNHEYNLWFTIGVPPTSDLEAVVQRLHELAGAETTRVMYTLKLFKIGVTLDMTGDRPADAQSKPEYGESDRARARGGVLSEADQALVRELQHDLPVTAHPFLEMANRLGVDEEAVITAINNLRERGFLRRVAGILYHRKAGFKANGMGVWAVPEDRVEEVGSRMAEFTAVSHCYRRPTYPDWPYNVFSMVHGRSVEECEDVFKAISQKTGITDYTSLYSTREYKKTRLMFYTPDYAEWEARYMPTPVPAS
ncbi:MAG: AsnC family transcriptional regulator [Chloroflexota bacterium]